MEMRCSTGIRTSCCKIKAHRIKAEEVERALSNDPIPIYEQDVDGEMRYVYYGETEAGRLLTVVLVERGENIRVVTAYDLDTGQKRITLPGDCVESKS